MSKWKKFARAKGVSPYVHWWVNSDRTPGAAQKEYGTIARGKGGAQSAPSNTKSLSVPIPRDEPDYDPGTGFVGDRGLPAYAKNPDFDPDQWKLESLACEIGDVRKDTVIVGIIDDGIALGNIRFRRPLEDHRHGTRFLAAWMQGGTHDGGPQPFGRQVSEKTIQKAMDAHSHNGILDEDGFNQHVHPAPSGGPKISHNARTLMRSAVHGTHVLDLATGADMARSDPDLLNRQRIIAVGLPTRSAIGMAGTFLEFYVAQAMQWIVELADELWRQKFGDSDPQGGFPVVINLSYGQQAGTKTGSSSIETTFKHLESKRRHEGRFGAPVRLVMPIGNDNLTRCNIHRSQKQSAPPLQAPWRIQPQDQSSNFVEVWADLKEGELDATCGKFPLKICLDGPGQAAKSWLTGEDAHIFDHPDGYLRIYADVIDIPDLSDGALFDLAAQRLGAPKNSGKRIRYVIAMRPTLDHEQPDREAVAGLWNIELEWSNDADFSDANDKQEGRDIHVNVQVDQEPTPWSDVNRRSYFDDKNYRTHLPSGRPLDSYSYLNSERGLAGQGENLEPADMFAPVQRKGTLNSLATHEDILVVAGHRLKDGRPTDFSATELPKDRRSHTGTEQRARSLPTASFPVDMSPSRTGVPASGSKSGSAVSLRGTSFAAPQATRWVVTQFLRAQDANMADLRKVATSAHLAKEARQYDKEAIQRGLFVARANKGKVGGGRMPGTFGVSPVDTS